MPKKSHTSRRAGTIGLVLIMTMIMIMVMIIMNRMFRMSLVIIVIDMIRLIKNDDVTGGSHKGAIQHQPVPIPPHTQPGNFIFLKINKKVYIQNNNNVKKHTQLGNFILF